MRPQDASAHLYVGARVRYTGGYKVGHLYSGVEGAIIKFDYDRYPLCVRVELDNGYGYWCRGEELAHIPVPGSRDIATLAEEAKANLTKQLQTVKTDAINPSHYRNTRFEVIDIIEAFGLGFNLGNVVKYILRAGKKDPLKHVEDLKKARWYLDREIANLEKP